MAHEVGGEDDVLNLLSEFLRCKSDPEEKASFFAALSAKEEDQWLLFEAIRQLEEKEDTIVLDLLLKWKDSPLVFQYVPSLLALRFTCNRKLKKTLDAILMSLYTKVLIESPSLAVIQSLSQSSVYHDGSKMDPTNQETLKIPSGKSLKFDGRGVEGRMTVAETLYRNYNGVMADLSPMAIKEFVKCTTNLLLRGFDGDKAKKRVNLTPGILSELLRAAFFCMQNNYKGGGGDALRLLELLRGRATAAADTVVLLLANAAKTLTAKNTPILGPNLVVVEVPEGKTLSKNLITNASFKTKKMGDDIPKVESESNVDNSLIATNLKILVNMKSISEEAMDEALDQIPKSSGLRMALSMSSGEPQTKAKEKLKSKLHHLPVTTGFRKRLNSESEKHKSHKAKSDDEVELHPTEPLGQG